MIEILSESDVPRGKIIVIRVREIKITMLLTKHLLDAAEDYSFKIENVLHAVIFPDEVVRGHSGRFVAHKLLNDYLVRIVYEYESGIPVMITLYICQERKVL